ncbi:MAG TPA: hypothetical protein PKI86_00800 [Chitinophagales bacterium]|nr:hypothetical protein [Chitinophagales bacterium]
MTKPSVEYACKVLPLGNAASIAIVVSISLSVMYIGIFTGIPVTVNIILFVGSMFLLLNFLTTYATFTISENKLLRTLNSTNFLTKNAKAKEYEWKDVKAYKNGIDKGRYRGEFQFLEIKFRNGDEWKITDMYGEGKKDFTLFQQYFIENVEAFNSEHKIQPPSSAVKKMGTSIPDEGLFIKRRKTFYETIWGKIVTVLLGIFILFIFLFARPYMNGFSVFKLYFVLIPGFAYMAYRSFVKTEE